MKSEQQIMRKRPPVDLLALTSGAATPMPEAVQRTAPPPEAAPAPRVEPKAKSKPAVKSANLEQLAFKVPPAFRKRFIVSAANADLKLNELLFAAFEAWEKQAGKR